MLKRSQIFATLLVPTLLAGCSGWEDDDPTPSLTPSPTPTVVDGAFPVGRYYYQSLYLFRYSEPNPYVITLFGFIEGSTPGATFSGEWNIALWYDEESYQSHPDESDCIIFERMEAVPVEDGTTGDLDLSLCEACDPISLFTSSYWDDNGCPQTFIDLWYQDPFTGEYDFEWQQYIGYRDALETGWPAEFAAYEESLIDMQASGALYDLVRKGDHFTPHYYVLPLPDDAKMQAKAPLFPALMAIEGP